MLRRPLGRTGAKLSILGVGGLIVSGLEQAEADRLVAEAVARGVNYFDVAPTYGNAQERLGPALGPYRKDCFLACKTVERSAAKAAEELAGSLRTLRTDHLDLYQLHGLTTVEEVEQVFAPGARWRCSCVRRKRGGRGSSASARTARRRCWRRWTAIPSTRCSFRLTSPCWYKSGFGREVLEAAERAARAGWR